MKKITVCFITLLITLSVVNSSSAQLAVRLYNYRPTGYFGAYIKPTVSAEIGSLKPFEEKKWVRISYLLTLTYLRPRLAEFPMATIMQDGNGTTVIPETASYKLYLDFQIHVGLDAAFFKYKKLACYGGTGIVLGEALIDYTAGHTHGIVTGTDAGLQFRLGAEYHYRDWLTIFASYNRTGFFLVEEDIGGFFAANDYGLGIIYDF